MKDRSMAIKHAKAKKEAMKEVLERQMDFAQTSWANSERMKWHMSRKPYCMK